MIRHFRILGIVLVFIGFLILLPNQVSGFSDDDDDGNQSNYLSISIDQATYLDYDGDGCEDDIITIFTIDARDISDLWNGKVHVDCYLESPSGIVNSFYFNDKMEYIYWYSIDDEMHMGRLEQYGLVWYNTASETGWYTFSVSAYGVGNNAPTSAYAETEFDPPGGGDPGLPEVGFM